MFREEEKPPPNFPFFPIRNPNPLARSFIIPEPVIHPPGVDPYSFYNPTSHSDGGSEPRPPLDVDPCAASRNEIITPRTDLTLSELSGGTLPESTTAVGTSDSPAISEAVVQQPVNDAEVIKVESHITQITRCDVCNVTCHSKDALKNHYEGQKHLKKLQKPEKNTMNELVQDESSIDSLLVCKIPDLGCVVNQNILMDHPESANPAGQVTSSVMPAQHSEDTQKARDNYKLKVHQSVWCDVCKVSCSSDKNFGTHVLGKKHLKNLKNSEKTTAIADILKSPERESESLSVDSEEGKKHMKNLEKLKKLPDLPSNPIASMTTPKLTNGEVVNSNEVKSVWCEVCAICCNTNEELKKHISGKKHRKNVKKSEKQIGHGPARARAGSLQDPTSEEGKVVILERCKRKEDSSMASDENAGGKRQKVMTEEGECGTFVTCEVCNVSCTNQRAFMSHLASHEHSTMKNKRWIKMSS